MNIFQGELDIFFTHVIKVRWVLSLIFNREFSLFIEHSLVFAIIKFFWFFLYVETDVGRILLF